MELNNNIFIKVPETRHEWSEYHNIARSEVFINIPGIDYDEMHPSFCSTNYKHFIAFHHNRIVGMMKAEDLQKTSEWALRIIGVKKDFQKQKIGTFLINHLKTILIKQGGKILRTHANEKSTVFYQKIGFIEEAWEGSTLNAGTKDLVLYL